MVTIREFAIDDAPAVSALVLSIQRHEFGMDVTIDEQPDLNDIAGYYRTQQGNFWVAQINGNLVGTIGLLNIGGGHAVLRKMFVAKEFRGQPFAVAHHLLTRLLRWAGAAGLRDVLLGTTAWFLAAHRFYAKHGFAEIPQHRLPSNFPLMRVDTKFYRRDLDGVFDAGTQAKLSDLRRRYRDIIAHR